MSFCPECGKAIGPSATNCASCGFALPEAEKKGGGAKFKGTVMMTAPAVNLKAAEPANANAKPEAPAMAANAPAPAMRAAAVPASPASPASAAGKGRLPAAKMTMMGAGVAPPMAKAAAAPASAKQAPAATPGAGVAAPVVKNAPLAAPQPAPAQFAATQAMPGPPPAPAQRVEPAASPNLQPPAQAKAQSAPRIDMPKTDADGGAAKRIDPASVDEARRIDRERSAVAEGATQALQPVAPNPAPKAERYLPGDPMAPGAGAHPAKQSTPRLALQQEDTYVVPKGEKKWMYWAIGGVVLVSVLLLAIGLL